MLASVLMCVVLVVSDGDSLTVRCGDSAAAGPLRVRVAEIDAPELRQAFGRRARQQLVGLCRGQRARIDVRAHRPHVPLQQRLLPGPRWLARVLPNLRLRAARL